jgi:acyl-activating enzyme 14
MQIEDYLYGKKLHLSLLGRKPENMDEEEGASLDGQVLGLVRLTLMRKVAYNVIKERSIVGLMTATYDMYEKLSANNKVYLMKNLFNLKMTERMSITQHLIISTLSRINCYMVKLNLMMSYEH